jgi:hypothetical protein
VDVLASNMFYILHNITENHKWLTKKLVSNMTLQITGLSN